MLKHILQILIYILYSKCYYAQNCGLKLFSEKVFLNFFSDSIHPSIRDFYYNLSLIKIANSSDASVWLCSQQAKFYESEELVCFLPNESRM
jgi:hypothetical protein